MNNIHISDRAQGDLAEIQEYISVELGNPSAAHSVLRRITADIRTLKNHAMLGTPLRSTVELLNSYRYLVTGNYLTFYRVSGDEVYIDRILYGRRNYVDILLGGTAEQKTES